MALTEDWEKSSFSVNGGECVEARQRTNNHGVTADVRDTQNRPQGHLSFSGSEWTALLDALR